MRALLAALLALAAAAQDEGDGAVLLQKQLTGAPLAAEDVEAPELGLPDVLRSDEALVGKVGLGFVQALGAMAEAGEAAKTPGDAWDRIHKNIADRFLSGIEESSASIDRIFQQIVLRLDTYDNRTRVVADNIAERVAAAAPDRRGAVVKRWSSGYLEQTRAYFVDIGQLLAQTADVATNGVRNLNPDLSDDVLAGFNLATSELMNFTARLDRAIQTIATIVPGHPAENGMMLQQVVASLESGVRRATDFKTHFDATFERVSASCIEKLHNHTQSWGEDEAQTYDDRANVALGRLSRNASHVAEDLLSSIVLIKTTVNAAVKPFLEAVESDAAAVAEAEKEMGATNSDRATREASAEQGPTAAPGAEQSHDETVSIKDAIDETESDMSATNSPRAAEEAKEVHEPTRAPDAERSDEETVSIGDATNETDQATHEDTSAASTTEVAIETKSAGVRAASSVLAAFAAAAGLLQFA